jgi:hypothetical protein
MNRLPFAVCVAAALAMGTFALQASAAGNDQLSQADIQKAVKTLPPMVVNGHHVPLVVQLQMIKKALKRPWTGDMSDTKLRCRVEQRTGSHFRTVRCEGNRHHIMRTNALRTALQNAGANGGSLPVESVFFEGAINASTLKPLLKKVRPADASYTLRVNGDNGKPLLDYIFKDGQLVRIYHHVYNNKQGTSDSGQH